MPNKQNLPPFLKEEHKLPNSKKIDPYVYTSLDSICRLREIGLKELLELLEKLKIEIKYQDIKDNRKLYVSLEDTGKISNEIFAERHKSLY